MGLANELTETWWRLFTAGKLTELSGIVADDVVFRGPGVEIRGRAELMPYLAIFKEAFPDIRPIASLAIEQGDQVITELVIEGTHTGPLRAPEGTIPPTGKRVVWKAADHVRVANGKIVAWSAHWDRVAFAAQLGLTPKQ
jgi:predicted ester cyclase